MLTGFCISSKENTLLSFTMGRSSSHKQSTSSEPRAATLASHQARIYSQLIFRSCFVQACRNVGLNANLPMRSEILVNVLWVFFLFFLPLLTPQNVLVGTNPTNTERNGSPALNGDLALTRFLGVCMDDLQHVAGVPWYPGP